MCVQYAIYNFTVNHISSDDSWIHGIWILSPCCLCHRLPRMTRRISHLIRLDKTLTGLLTCYSILFVRLSKDLNSCIYVSFFHFMMENFWYFLFKLWNSKILSSQEFLHKILKLYNFMTISFLAVCDYWFSDVQFGARIFRRCVFIFLIARSREPINKSWKCLFVSISWKTIF